MIPRGIHGPAGRRGSRAVTFARGRATARPDVDAALPRFVAGRGPFAALDGVRRDAGGFDFEAVPALRREAPRCDGLLLLMRGSFCEKACGRLRDGFPVPRIIIARPGGTIDLKWRLRSDA